jgi:hypothetical protein
MDERLAAGLVEEIPAAEKGERKEKRRVFSSAPNSFSLFSAVKKNS